MRQIKSVSNQYDSVHTCLRVAVIYKYTKFIWNNGIKGTKMR